MSAVRYPHHENPEWSYSWATADVRDERLVVGIEDGTLKSCLYRGQPALIEHSNGAFIDGWDDEPDEVYDGYTRLRTFPDEGARHAWIQASQWQRVIDLKEQRRGRP